MSHDPMCPQYDQTERTIAMFDTPCRCEEYARVRSNEREQVGRVWAKREDLRDAASNESHLAALEARDHELAHAEAVAAKLVGVICEDAETIDGLRGALWDLAHVRGAVDEIVREEVARLRVESMDALTAERDAARAEVANLRAQIARDIEAESARASVRELSDPNAYARRVAYDNAARIARQGGAR